MAIQSPRPSAFAATMQKISGRLLLGPGEIVRHAARLDRATLAWGALILAVLLALSANLIVGAVAKNAKRLDELKNTLPELAK